MSSAQAVPEPIVAASEVPKVTLELITGTRQGVERAGGIFTKDDLISIKLYVKDGLALPTQLGEVEVYVGYKKADIAGLEPVDIKDLFDQVRTHCISWDSVERKVISQSNALETSAQKIVTTGDAFISDVEQLPISKRVMKLEAARAEEFKFTEEDSEVAMILGDYLDALKLEIEDQEKNTQAVYDSVHDFRVVLVGGTLVDKTSTPGLEPQVKRKKDLMERNGLVQKIEADEQAIKEKEGRIDQLNKDYKKFTGLAFTGAAGGPVGLAITGGIFGDKAEKARKEKNKLIAEVSELRAKVREEKNLQRAIFALDKKFSDMGLRMLDAQSALDNLQFMWQCMLEKIKTSKREWDHVDNGKSLMLFLTIFKSIINPWRDVRDLSRRLVKSMDEGLAEYKRLYAK